MAFYGTGLFEFVGPNVQNYFKNAHWALSQTNMWEWLANFTPQNNEDFLFCNDDNLKIVEQKMFEQDVAHDHSGLSFAYTMRNMKYIAQHGYDAFHTMWLNNNRTTNQIDDMNDMNDYNFSG